MTWRPKRRATDPVLGDVTLDGHGWEGRIASPEGTGTIWVRVERTESEPLEIDRSLIRGFVSDYAALRPALKRALFQLWEPHLAEPAWPGSRPDSADTLWPMLQLEGVTVRRLGAVDLAFAFAGEYWPDAVFNVRVNGETAVPLSLDD